MLPNVERQHSLPERTRIQTNLYARLGLMTCAAIDPGPPDSDDPGESNPCTRSRDMTGNGSVLNQCQHFYTESEFCPLREGGQIVEIQVTSDCVSFPPVIPPHAFRERGTLHYHRSRMGRCSFSTRITWTLQWRRIG
jgi:hypothetical protein